jgi:hypothetical protein
MSEPSTESSETTPDTDLDAEEYGSLTVEDEGAETVDPADLAGTADDDDEDIGYSPDHSGAEDGPS